MTIHDIGIKIGSIEYDFLRDNPNLGKNVILLGLGGSHAYGTNNESSDLDIKGCALNLKSDILGGSSFEQFIDEDTDTVIFSFNKFLNLLYRCNPSAMELLGLEDWQYIHIDSIGQELLNNKKMFISKKCVDTFGQYANQQLYRLNQLSTHQMDNDKLEHHILTTLNRMKSNFNEDFKLLREDDFINLYIDKSESDNLNTEIFMDIKLSHYPLRDYCGMWNIMQNTVKQYNQLGSRNRKALEHNKISKHMMHLVRLYHMCFDILEYGDIFTFRRDDHNELMEIRNGKYVDSNNQIDSEFFNMVDELENKLKILKDKSIIPEKSNLEDIINFKMSVNERVVKGNI